MGDKSHSNIQSTQFVGTYTVTSHPIHPSEHDLPLTDFHLTYEEDSEGNCVPIITLEVMSDSSNGDSCEATANETPPSNEYMQQSAGVHFLTDKPRDSSDGTHNRDKEQDNSKESTKVKLESGEYRIRSDGSVVCKLCGEVLQSRTHWYRHKYKMHVPPALNPSPLYQCEQCLVFFKSRKGYIGHVASRHSDVLSEPSAQSDSTAKEQPTLPQQQQQQQQHNLQQLQQLQIQSDLKDEIDPEIVISKSIIPAYPPPSKPTTSKPPEQKRPSRSKNSEQHPEWEEKRIREEKLVSDIIDRVRRECEAQGSGGPTRKGYSRRTTAMNT